jgi:hypothetical protein
MRVVIFTFDDAGHHGFTEVNTVTGRARRWRYSKPVLAG